MSTGEGDASCTRRTTMNSFVLYWTRLTRRKILSHVQTRDDRVSDVEVRVHPQLGHLVRHLQKHLRIHDGGGRGNSVNCSRSGSRVTGQQLTGVRIRWHLMPGNASLSHDAACLQHFYFPHLAPNTPLLKYELTTVIASDSPRPNSSRSF